MDQLEDCTRANTACSTWDNQQRDQGIDHHPKESSSQAANP
uniref:Uncharacterized protein n=1 Tax=Rhizophora mucronata TaxID=61149 RepID=A0A2P2QBR8_RHIMU